MIVECYANSWSPSVNNKQNTDFVNDLEIGKVIYLPRLAFSLSSEEQKFLTPNCADPKSKNINFDPTSGTLRGTTCQGEDFIQMKNMMERFAQNAHALVLSLFPHYTPALRWGRTSYRTINVVGRKVSSYRKDDTRLHVDSFAATPVQGLRLLRVFSNVNPEHPRVWNLGEPFESVAEKFLPHISANSWISPWILKKLNITKDLRSPYDHYMLQIHNKMKQDDHYQKTVPYQQVAFPGGSTWVVMTDKVSHAALSGQYLFEQTFYLPVNAMKVPDQSPLHILERLVGKQLIQRPSSLYDRT